MRLFRAPDAPPPPQLIDRTIEMFAASRHDDQLITARAIPADPYDTWMDQRESDRRLRASLSARLGTGDGRLRDRC